MGQPSGQGQHGAPAAVIDDGVLPGRYRQPVPAQQLPQEPMHRCVGRDLLRGDLQEGRAIRPQLGQPALFHVPSLPAHYHLELGQGGAEVIGPDSCFRSTEGPWVEALARDADAERVKEEVTREPSQRGHPGVFEGPPPGLGSNEQSPALGYELLQLLHSHVTHGLKAVHTRLAGQMGLDAGVYAPHREQAAQCPQFCLHHDLASAARIQPAHSIEQKGAQFTHGE